MPPTVSHWLILVAVSAAASVTQSVSGFGFGVVVVALLPVFGIPIQHAVVLVTLLVGVNIAIALWRVREHFSLHRVLWLMIGVPFGIPVGICLLTEGPAWLLRGLLGLVLVLAVVEPLLRRGSATVPPERRRWALFAGFCSGALGGALSTGGPPVVIYFFRRHWSKEVTKAAIMAVFVVTVGVRTVAYVLKGDLITSDRLIETAVLVPVVVGASLMGERLFRAISQAAFRRAVAAVIVLCALYQLYRAAMSLLDA